MIEPTESQIEKAEMMGWHFLGDGLFSRGEEIGYFTSDGFHKE